MLDPKIYLQKDFVLNADMLNALLIEGTKVIYSEEDGVMLRVNGNGPYAISTKSSEAMTKMAKLIAEERYSAIVRPFKFLPELFSVKGNSEIMPCYQIAYHSNEPVAEETINGFEIKPLTKENLEFVCENYDDDKGYIESRIERGMLGAFDEKGKCGGFIGFHEEGSIGLLKVLSEYRRKGIGIALEKKMINRCISEGKIPFGHVVVGNEKSMCLQRKLDMEISENIVTWVFKD